MTRIFSRDTTSIAEGIQSINMTVKDKGRVIAMFCATFNKDVLSTFTAINMDLPLSFIGQETTRFMARAYSIITGLDAGYIEFELCEDL